MSHLVFLSSTVVLLAVSFFVQQAVRLSSSDDWLERPKTTRGFTHAQFIACRENYVYVVFLNPANDVSEKMSLYLPEWNIGMRIIIEWRLKLVQLAFGIQLPLAPVRNANMKQVSLCSVHWTTWPQVHKTQRRNTWTVSSSTFSCRLVDPDSWGTFICVSLTVNQCDLVYTHFPQNSWLICLFKQVNVFM